MSYSVGVNNQIAPPQGSLLAYDKAGEMTVDNAGNVYTYDAEGRVTQVNDGSYVTTYTYDGNGQRVGKQSTMASKLYWYGPDGKILNESDTSGNVTDRFGWFNGEMVARLDTSGNVLHYLYHDHLGSTRLVVTPTGQVQDDLDYYPFGTAIAKQSTSGNNYQFTGYETDTESQTEHAWFRNLNPNLGRYMRPDPYGGSYVPYDPQSMNRYSYVNNRLLNYTDPYGLICMWDDGTADDDPSDGGADQATCEQQGGTWLLTFYGGTTIYIPGAFTGTYGTPYPANSLAAGGSGQKLNNSACLQPNTIQQLEADALGFLSSLTGRTLGVGAGASGAMGTGGGFAGTASAQLVASPNGSSGLEYTLSSSPFGLMASGEIPTAGALGGVQISVSNAGSIQDLGGSFTNISAGAGAGWGGGADYASGSSANGENVYQFTATAGGAIGGFGAAGTQTLTTIKPFCQ